MTDLSALIARVEEGTGPDRELDACLRGWLHSSEVGEPIDWSPRYTTSLDAVLSLIEQKLPGWHWGIQSPNHGYVTSRETGRYGTYAKSPARALLAATLRVLSALEDSKADLADATNGDRP